MKTFEIFKYSKKHPLSIKIGRYENGTIGIQSYTHEDGYPEPWSNLTVNLSIKTEAFSAFIDIENNGEELVDDLIKNNFGELTGRYVNIGEYNFPEFKFNVNTLKEYDEDGAEEYEAYAEALSILEE